MNCYLQVRSSAGNDEGNLSVQVEFLSKVFAIFVAFQIELYFYQTFMLQSNDLSTDNGWDRFTVRLIWLALVLVRMPFAVGLTSDFSALSDGTFRRSFTEVTSD